MWNDISGGDFWELFLKEGAMFDISVQLFAVARDLAGCDSVTLAVPDGATVAVLREKLFDRVPALAPLTKSLQIAVDQEYAIDTTPLTAQQEVAIIPPVSGG